MATAAARAGGTGPFFGVFFGGGGKHVTTSQSCNLANQSVSWRGWHAGDDRGNDRQTDRREGQENTVNVVLLHAIHTLRILLTTSCSRTSGFIYTVPQNCALPTPQPVVIAPPASSSHDCAPRCSEGCAAADVEAAPPGLWLAWPLLPLSKAGHRLGDSRLVRVRVRGRVRVRVRVS